MKKKKLQALILLLVLFLNFFLANAFSQDYTRWSLPTGAKMRLGKGTITGNIVFSPDNSLLAVPNGIGTWIYDAGTGKELQLLTDNTGYVTNVAFSPDGKTLACSVSDKFQLWDVANGELKLAKSIAARRIYDVAFSPDGKTIATAGSKKEKGLQLWDVATGTLKTTFLGLKAGVDTLAFSPDGKTIATGGDEDGTIKLWNVATAKLKSTLKTASDSDIQNLAFSPDGKTIASCDGSLDTTVELWDVASGKLRTSLTGHIDGVAFVSFSPDSRTLASGGRDGTLILWDVETGRYKTTLIEHKNRIEGLTFSPNGETLASGSWDGRIILWDTETLQIKTTITGHVYGFQNIMFSPDGNKIASGSIDKTIRLWDTKNGGNTSTFIGHIAGVESIAFSPDGKTIASGGGSYTVNYWFADDYTVRLWDVDSGINKATLLGHRRTVYYLTFSPDGNYLVSSAGDKRAIFWDTATGYPLWTITGEGVPHTRDSQEGEFVGAIKFSADGKTFVSADNIKVRLWDTESRKTIATFFSPTPRSSNIAFSPDGKTVATMWKENEMYLLDVTTGQTMQFITGHTSKFATIAFSPDGQTLASAGIDGSDSVRLWNPKSGELKLSLAGMPSGIDDVAFSPDGQTLATASWDGTILLWDVPSVINQPLHEADITGDEVLSMHDLMLVAANLGKTGALAVDVNYDEVVNIADLIKIAGELEIAGIKPELSYDLEIVPTTADVENWIKGAQQLNLTDIINQKGYFFLVKLLHRLTPTQTALLPNYPNPFNPETWIPYQLASPADVAIRIYSTNGNVIRTLDVGHQSIGLYHHRNSAAYWDGKNDIGETVASGVYFYTLTAGAFTATRKMLIRK